LHLDRSLPILAFTSLSSLALLACETQSVSGNKILGSGGSGGSGGSATSSSTSSSGDGGTAASSTGISGSSSSSSGGGAGGDGGAGGGGGTSCTMSAADSIYAIGSDKKLYRLYGNNTSSLASSLIGALTCPTAADPHSMTVDRSGTAWVVYTDGKLFKVDTATAACTGTSFATGQHGFTSFSVAFAASAKGSTTETLYASGSGDAGGATGLARIDTTTLTLTPIGSYDNPVVEGHVQLAGTADGRLYGGFLSGGTYYNIAHLDPTNAHVSAVDNGPSLLLKGKPADTRYSIIPWGKANEVPGPTDVDKFYIFTTVSNGTKNYSYNGWNAISTDADPNQVTPIIAVTVGASTCATSNPPF
jgi:hypothetical protein